MAQFKSKRGGWLTVLFSLIYFVSYITRINFGAVISEIEIAENMPKTLLSLAITGSFVTYGAGQIISGFIGDRAQPKLLIVLAFTVTGAMNYLIPFCNSPYQMAVVWCINGIAQAFMWPPLVRLMSELFTLEEYSYTSIWVSYAASIGTIAIYLLAPLLIAMFNWKAVFFFTGTIAFLMCVVCVKFCPSCIEKTKNISHSYEGATEQKRVKNQLFTAVMFFVMLAIVCQGALRDSITTWMPTYVLETFRLNTGISILTGALLPILGILGIQITSTVYRKWFLNNPLDCAGVSLCISFACLVLLLLVSDFSPVLSVLFLGISVGFVHGVNWVLVTVVPANFKRFGNISLVSGVLNACTYIGSAVSTYGVAYMCEQFNWFAIIACWASIALLGSVILFAFAKSYRKKILNK